VGSADDATAAALAGAVPLAEHPFDATRRQRYEVTRTRGGYSLAEEGEALQVATTVQEVCDAIVARSLRRAVELASLKGWVRLRGALVDLDGSRVLLVGSSGAGKTVLALRLALGGAVFQGDDSVLLREGLTLAVPCLPILRPGAEALLPEFAGSLQPASRAYGPVTLEARAAPEAPWRLRMARIDHVVVLERSGRHAICAPTVPARVLPHLAGALAPVTESRPAMVRALAAMLSGTRCHTLSVGEPGETERALRLAAC
jgi:hypothetical protein